MNTGLPEEAAQRAWLEDDLAAHAGRPIYLFQHLPLYLWDQAETDLGHYDNLGQPARAWLLDLVRRHGVELVFSGHSHFSFFDRVDAARYFVTPSTSFTRPGFSEAFASGPPAERGRDDVAKLGFFLVRVQEDGPRVHLVRTGGEKAPSAGTRLMTRLSRDLPASPLGLTLRHPLAHTAEVPLAWPSVVRQRVRNDYPLLSCLELGVRHLRVPAGDLSDSLQRWRLALLRAEGVAVTASWLWREGLDLAAAVAALRGEVDTVELRLPGAFEPPPAALAAAARCRGVLGVPVALSPIVARERTAGKQLPRARLAYHLGELPALDAALVASDAKVDRALCLLPPDASLPALRAIGAVDFAVELTGDDDYAQVVQVAEALLTVTRWPGSRLFLEPLIDLDRTMDGMHGLLDRACNPRQAYDGVRCLNTVLFSGSKRDAQLVLSGSARGPAVAYGLRTGTSRAIADGEALSIHEPTLLDAGSPRS